MIAVKNVSKIYKKGESETLALDNVSFSIKNGEYVAIMGPSGSGKSTLMHILGMLDNLSSGDYQIEGTSVNQLSKNELARIRNKRIGFVFQSFNLLPRATAMNNVILPMIYGGINKSKRRKTAVDLLQRMGLEQRLDYTSNQLSGGEMQRVAIARALAMDPDIILADEPTGNIASAQSLEIMKLLNQLNGGGHTIVLITHDQNIARHSRRIITLKDGRLISDRQKSKGTR